MSERWAVTVTVNRPDGSVEHVRVGTAVKAGENFSVSFDAMSIRPEGAAPPRASSTRASSGGSAPRAAGGGDGMVFPPYGRSKGLPVSGASLQDLEFYANGCRRTLGDPGKARWHDKEKVLLAAIEAEIASQGAGGGDQRGPGDDDVPPPSDDDAPPF
jgi:hypothetical protein